MDVVPRGFDWALEQLRNGARLQRRGWNGKGMWICLQKGYPAGIPVNKNTAEATGIQEGVIARFLPYIMLKVVSEDVAVFVPWVASHTDLLSRDWEFLVET